VGFPEKNASQKADTKAMGGTINEPQKGERDGRMANGFAHRKGKDSPEERNRQML